MRLGEIKQKLDLVIDRDNYQIVLEQKSLYGDRAYIVKNYFLIIDALKSIKDFDWAEQDFNLIQEIIDIKSNVDMSVELTQDEFNKMNTYISTIDQKLPIFYSILNSVVTDQDKMVVNIKLPQSINKITKLSELNKRLEKVLKLYNVDGQFDFQEFDKGTNWYVVLATGQLSYWMLIGGLNIANKFFNTKKTYYDAKESKFNSKEAELDYRAATNKKKITQKELKEYIDRKLKLQVEQDVSELSDKVDDTNNKIENLSKILKATKLLIEELEKGEFEFHLSLNPPEDIVSESGGILTVDYNNLPKISDEKEVKKIDSKKDSIKK